jgi:hypothetical protein
MDKQQRRINAQYNEDRHEPETAINIIFDKHFGRYDKTTISRFTLYCPSFDVINVGLFVMDFRKLWKYFFWSSAVLVRNKSSLMHWRLKIP